MPTTVGGCHSHSDAPAKARVRFSSMASKSRVRSPYSTVLRFSTRPLYRTTDRRLARVSFHMSPAPTVTIQRPIRREIARVFECAGSRVKDPSCRAAESHRRRRLQHLSESMAQQQQQVRARSWEKNCAGRARAPHRGTRACCCSAVFLPLHRPSSPTSKAKPVHISCTDSRRRSSDMAAALDK